ncbi:hypothetical protein [Sphingomonas sp. G-3-2-10]|jgi:hypothetical protein|uniref:hypothetical protein n=1 Tax=Sphingomonas sp. G-3-2-10 TaxID=2728838 RepID=UPI00146D8243|nr:hypothetical protein [Sphingomonas sp. G-3-2-10]NML04780.1 hypothetical protein [Sphingomonas sp. G-3-2-10]
MTEFLVFLYAMLAMFVVMSMRRNQKLQRPSSPMLTMAGWGLFSLSTTLALLLGGVALAIAMGMNVPLGNFETML